MGAPSARGAASEQPRAAVEANRELFDAIEYAVTEGRLDLRDLVDAYTAGAPELDFIDAWNCVEDYLKRIASVQASGIAGAHARVERALPDWRRRLELRIAAHDLALARTARSVATTTASNRHASPSQTCLTARATQTPAKTNSTRSSSSCASSTATSSVSSRLRRG